MPSHPNVEIHARLEPKLNFAAHQNRWAGLTALAVHNPGETPLEDIELTLESDPPIIRRRTWRIDRLPAGTTTEIEDKRLDVDVERLRTLSEAITAAVRWRTRARGDTIGDAASELEILAANEWGGTAVTPALLAAFCIPNNPAIDKILADSAGILRTAHPGVQLEGYNRSRKTEVWAVAQAVYAAVAERRLAYSTPPASFETNGQKIRLPDRVLDTGIATCLDITLLMAAAFEQAKLNPIIAMPKNHALVGVWLTDDTLPGPFTTDPETLRKRADLNDLLLIETTFTTDQPTPSFKHAVAQGRRALDRDGDADYAGTVDIRRAREHDVRPLAFDDPAAGAAPTNGSAAAAETGTTALGHEPAPAALLEADAAAARGAAGSAAEPPGRPAAAEAPNARVERWLRQLLDLSLRNPLLNHRETKATLPVVCPDPALLEDKLASGKRMRLDPKVENAEDLTLLESRRDEQAAAKGDTNPLDGAARDALEHNRLLIDLDAERLETQSVDLYRKTRTALEEGGANTLYLMLGFLHWRRNTKPERRLKAPLVLIPITLERTSIKARMHIVKHDDEPRFNTTLLEMLRQDYRLEVDGLDGPLPTDEHGVHVDEIWNRVRRAILDTPQLEVTTDVRIGNASFAKHLMWSDLRDRRDALRGSPVVAQLLDADIEDADTRADREDDASPYDAALYGGTGQPAVPAREIDSRYGPAELLMPLPADGSQTAAVADAHEGRSFVLIGPPGTGKSQTIANLIAHYLGNRRTVLFASEKTAALNVVHQRLKEIGLDAHCLELHSNKSKKADVIARLERAWNPLPGAAPPPRRRRGRPPRDGSNARGRTQTGPAQRPLPETTEPASPTGEATRTDAAWRRESDELADIRQRLNDVPERLHCRWPNGLTPYEAIGITGKRPDLADAVKLRWPTPDQHTEQDLANLHRLADRLGRQAAAAAKAGIGPLHAVHRVQSDRLPQNPDEMLRTTAEEALDTAEHRFMAGSTFRAMIGLGPAAPTAPNAAGREAAEYRLAKAVATLDGLEGATDAPEPWSGRITDAGTPELLETLKRAAEEVRDEAATLSARYRPETWLRIDGERVGAAHAAAATKWWPARTVAQRRLKNFLVREGGLPAGSDPDVGNDARALAALRTIHGRIDEIRRKLPCELPAWTPEHIGPLAALATRARELRLATHDDALYDTAAGTAEGSDDRKGVAVSTGQRDEPGPGGRRQAAIRHAAQALVETHEALIDKSATLTTVIAPRTAGPGRTVGPGRTAPGHTRPDGHSAAETFGMAKTLSSVIPELKVWRPYQRRRGEAAAAGLQPLVEALDAGRVQPGDAGAAFEAAYAAWWSDSVIAGDEVLREFSSVEQENDIDRFRNLDERYRSTTAELVALRAREGIPAREGFPKSSEWGVLAREIQKKKRHKSVRQLIKECPDAIRRLAPCLMMSPLSVAQYLDPETRFDVVILDEASQITGCDAIGVLARANQVIVAGDPKQMPPTTFFSRQAPTDEIDEEDEDLESILDDLLACGMPTRHLEMHYRSKCESLITFSNRKYYDHKLVTFPTRSTRDHALTLVRPDGFYARGESRHNEGEAKAVATEVVRRLTHADDGVRRLSIGVIAVNSQQQRLIENLLDRERGLNPDIEWAFNSTVAEPVFVKNIETVQGDERDVILFSMTYGPDQNGKVTLNFGPLSREGGERRLNVALTRARSEMTVFSTLHPDKINLSGSHSRASEDIKHLLQFAENGREALEGAAAAPLNDFESPLEAQIAAELRKLGWAVHAQIGTSGYRIDLGVVDPENEGRYLAGIEADGAMYHSAAGARERDKIRQAALEARGWTMLRVWSTNWWTNRAGETAKLDSKLRDLPGGTRIQQVAKRATHVRGRPDDGGDS